MSKLQVSTYSLNLFTDSLASALADVKDSVRFLHGFNPEKIADHVDNMENYIDFLIASGSIGVWDSQSHGRVVWARLMSSTPVYIPVILLLEGRKSQEIGCSAYRAVFLDLNNALLQSEGFE